MSDVYFRYDGTVLTPVGAAVPSADIAVLGQPADFSTQPGSPLQAIYSQPNSNSASISTASWAAQEIAFTFSAPPPADVLADTYIAVSGVSPTGYNSTLEEPWLVLSVVGNVVTVAALTHPGSYSSGGTVTTSVLPNPTLSDGNGNFFFYTLPGLVSVQIYYSTVELDFTDQQIVAVGTGTGTVTSVALTMPAEFSVAGSPITTAGTFAVTKATQNPNLVYAGPASGGAAVPTFRVLVAGDLPGGSGTVSSVALTLTVPSSIFTVSITGSPITTSGTLAQAIGIQNQTENTVWAGPTSGSPAPPTFRALVTADLPGAVVLIADTFSRNQGTSLSATPIGGAPASNLIRVSVYLFTLTAGTGGTATYTLGFEDSVSQSQSFTSSTVDLTALGSFQQATYFLDTLPASTPTIAVTVAGATGSPVWKVVVVAEEI